jgi:Domain of unknown function (DUF1841)
LSSQVFGGYTREQLRSSYAEAWRKHLARIPVTPLESLIADVIARHPEYQSLVSDAAAAQAFESPAGGGAEELAVRLGEHDAEHVLMEALAETLWEAQRGAQPPDERRYLERARARVTT